MPLMTLSVQHGQTSDEARKRLETAVHDITSRFGYWSGRVEWSTDRSQVRLEGSGCWIEMQVDAQAVHVSADIPVLGRLLGAPSLQSQGDYRTHLSAQVARGPWERITGC